MAQGKATPEEFMTRFETLKRQYFYPPKPKFDDGEEVPSAYPERSMIVNMFERMGVEIPMHPNEPAIVKNQRADWMVGDWWSKPRPQR